MAPAARRARFRTTSRRTPNGKTFHARAGLGSRTHKKKGSMNPYTDAANGHGASAFALFRIKQRHRFKPDKRFCRDGAFGKISMMISVTIPPNSKAQAITRECARSADFWWPRSGSIELVNNRQGKTPSDPISNRQKILAVSTRLKLPGAGPHHKP